MSRAKGSGRKATRRELDARTVLRLLLFGAPAGPKADPDFAAEVRHEIVGGLYAHAPGLQLLFVGATLVMGAVLYGMAPTNAIAAWMVATLLAIAVLLFLCRRYAAVPRDAGTAPRWALLFAIGAGASALAFGSAACFFFFPGDPVRLVLFALMVFGLGGSAVAGYAIHMPVFLVVFLSGSAPFLARLLAEGDRMHMLVALLMVLWIVGFAMIARLIHIYLVERIRLQVERARLIRNLDITRFEAEQASAAKSQFLAHMGHELRTPLNAIIGFSEMMRNEVYGPLGAERYRTYADHIRESGGHLMAVITDIIDTALSDERAPVLAEEEVDLDRLASVCIATVEGRARTRGVGLTTDIPDGLPPVLADPTKLRQILINLLYNAVKFTPKGGHVRLFARSEPQGGFAIGVADTGIGMAREDIPRALTPFVQLRRGGGNEGEGAGLGLPLARNLAELHGGTLDIESAPGEGTTVTVRLPSARVAGPAA